MIKLKKVKCFTARVQLVVLRSDAIREMVQSLKLGTEALDAECKLFLGEELSQQLSSIKIDALLGKMFCDMQSLIASSETAVHRLEQYFEEINCLNMPELSAYRASIEHEVILLTELVVNTFTERTDYDGTQNYHLFRVLYSGGLCFVPGARRHSL